MRLGFTSSLAALLVGAGVVLAQSPGAAPTQALSPVPAKSAAVPATMDMPEPTFGYNPTLFSTGCSGGCGVPTTPTESCYPYYRCWASADYLLWSIQKTPTTPFAGQSVVGLIQVDDSTSASSTTVTLTHQVVITTDGTVTTTNTTDTVGPTTVGPVTATTTTPIIAGIVAVVPGADSSLTGEHSGAQFTIGAWLDPEQCCGVEARYFKIERRTAFSTVDTGNQAVLPPTGQLFSIPLPQPLPQTVPPTPADAVISLANVRGTLTTALGNDLWGAEANATHRLCYFGSMVIDGFCGFRYIDFREAYQTTEAIQATFPPNTTTTTASASTTDGPITVTDPNTGTATTTTITTTTTTTTQSTDKVTPNPANFTIIDRISTRNQFWGGQVGGQAEWYYGKFFITARGQVAVGGVHQTVDIFGVTIAPNGGELINQPNPPNPSLVTPGGLITSGADIGRHTRNRFSIIPETYLQVGCQLTSCLRCFVGWDYIYFNHIARPTNQTQFADTTVDVTVAGTTTSVPVKTPVFRFTDGNMWVSGATMGFELRF